MYPVLIDVFGVSISSFGVMLALGVVLGTWVAANLFEERGLPREWAWTVAIWMLLGGLIGAKVWFLAERWLRNPAAFELRALVFGAGGLTWYGGLVGGLVGGALGLRREPISLWAVIHFAALPLLIAQALGRIGCFLVGDDYGRASTLPWALAFPNGMPPTFERVHPTMLYESAWLALCAALLWPRRRTSPALFGEYLVLMGSGRFVNEFLRVNPPLLGPLSNAQVTSLVCIATGVSLWIWARRSAGANVSAAVTPARRGA